MTRKTNQQLGEEVSRKEVEWAKDAVVKAQARQQAWEDTLPTPLPTPDAPLADLVAADARIQQLANNIARLYEEGHLDKDALHELISDATLIRSSIRFATRALSSL